MRETVLILAGLPGAGKTTAATYFKSKKIPVARMGEVTDFYLSKTNLEKGEDSERVIRESLRKKQGLDIYARLTFDKIKPLTGSAGLIVIEGMRSDAEYQFFLKKFKNLKLVYIEADKIIRHKRLIERKHRPLTSNQIKTREEYEVKILRVERLQNYADFIVKNTGKKQTFFVSLENLLKSSQLK